MSTHTAPSPVGISETARPVGQKRLLALLAWLVFATLLTLTVWSVHPWFISQHSHPAVTLTQQRFQQLPDEHHAGSGWQEVQLPDTWAGRGHATSGSGRYEVLFQLAQHPRAFGDDLWALRIDRLSFKHKIWLNGHLIHTDLQTDATTGRPMAYLAQVPQELFVQGLNKLDIEVHYGSLGGLSLPLIGRLSDVEGGHLAQAFLTETLPRSVNEVAAMFAAFLILIWSKRRGEVAMGLLGLLCVVVSVRNWSYYVVHSPTLPPDLSAWLYFTAQTLATALLGAFAMAIAGRWRPWFVKLLWAVVLLFPVAAGIGATHGMLAQVRAVLYPGLLVLMLPTLFLLLRVPTQYGGWSALGMVLGIAVSLVAGIHDYLRLQGMISVMHTYWLPLASPITLASYGVVLINRFVQAMAEVEQHNVMLESRVEERTRDLVAANAAKGHFLSAASHDLRQPVAAVGLLSSLLKDKLKHTDLHDITQRLSDAVHAMENLLSGLLDLSRLEAGAIKPHRQAVALGDLLLRISSHVGEAASLKGIALRVHPTQAVAFSDPVLLEQMLRNLIGNALRYTPRGGVLVGVRRRGQRLLVQIWDTGDGIAPEHQQRIFEDFVQLGNPERNQAKGLGLGLAIVQRAAQLLDHPVTVRSRVGKGSCFCIDVPLYHAQASIAQAPIDQSHQDSTQRLSHAEPSGQLAAKQHTAKHAGPSGSAHEASFWAEQPQPLEGKHIIVLDDDASVRHAVAARVKSWGAHVTPLASLDELDELLQRVMSVDMLITDHQLCDGDGIQAIRIAHAVRPQLAVLLITGDTGAPHLQALMASGIPVLHKPFKTEALLQVIGHQICAKLT